MSLKNSPKTTSPQPWTLKLLCSRVFRFSCFTPSPSCHFQIATARNSLLNAFHAPSFTPPWTYSILHRHCFLLQSRCLCDEIHSISQLHLLEDKIVVRRHSKDGRNKALTLMQFDPLSVTLLLQETSFVFVLFFICDLFFSLSPCLTFPFYPELGEW